MTTLCLLVPVIAPSNQVSSHDQNTNSLLPTTSAPTATPSREGGDGRVVFGRWDLPAPNFAVAAGVVAATAAALLAVA
eukprot:CAMPEP_0179453086 /NCGR_PEP_ID=MMETSP0799-20121207/36850_1 /TAXON_ID=46947 /ORGANISM="Geminigera cryophila, Strain CCMP2564" /LENGTH=77 /DNA_ID=CAMNT_0021249413 /DNA_START=227 /DNA_END=457 /DNA_ORIENTATION=-